MRGLSIVVPAYNEERNLPLLRERLATALAGLDLPWELVVVDDHSADGTFAVAEALGEADPRVRVVRVARNGGSHVALLCGLAHARGDAAVVLAADLQDPPEVVPAMVDRWREGAQIVWATRKEVVGPSAFDRAASTLFYWIMRRVAGVTTFPPAGADFFLADRRVIDALAAFPESNASVHALINWMGFRQACVPYDKAERVHGESGWTLAKKIKLAVDTIVSFTFVPIRAMSTLGFGVSILGFLYAANVVRNAIVGQPVEGWSSLMVVVLVLGGFQMVMLGVLGEYLWRTLDESRRRPRYLIEAEAGVGLTPEGAPTPPERTPA